MKKTIIALLALSGVAMAADSITLESKLVSGDNTFAVYSQWETIQGNTAYIEAKATTYGSTPLTFYVKVADLFGADQLSDTDKYQITSFSFLGHQNGNCSDGGDILTVSLGEKSVSGTVTASQNRYTNVVFETPGEDTLSFTSSDILTLTLTPGSGGNGNVEIMYYDTPRGNQALGAASALNAAGTDLNYFHVDANNNGNGWQTNWKTDAPVVKMSVVAAVPEPTTATLSLLALAGLAARRRRK